MGGTEYRIQQVSNKLEVPESTIRYWETEFIEIIKPRRTNGRQRRYSDKDVEQLMQIKELLHHKNRSIEQAKHLLKSGNDDVESINWEKQSILLTGGTGTFGRHFCKFMLEKHNPRVIRIFSRDALKQHEMCREFGDEKARYFLGDVREADRLKRAMEGADIIVHAADLKHISLCEFNPFEAVKTNIHGAQNIIDAAIDVGVKKVIALSSDMAVNPVNLYGATKLCAEKIFIQGNAYSGSRGTRFSCIRFSDALISRGNVLDFFQSQKKTGIITIGDHKMTRFWPDFQESAGCVLRALSQMQGGEIFVSMAPSIMVTDLAAVIAPECKIEITGMSPGEKLHTLLITEEEARNTVLNENMYIILSDGAAQGGYAGPEYKRLPVGFEYVSHKNNSWLHIPDLKRICGPYLHLQGLASFTTRLNN